MKKIALILTAALLLTMLAACGEQAPAKTDTPTTTQPATTPETTEAPTQAPTEAPTQAPTEATEVEPMTDIDPMGLVGTWKRTHAEIEGDKTKNTKGTITVAGPDAGSLIFTFKDQESSNFNAKEKALTVEAGALYDDCGNDIWYAKAESGSNTYEMTLLDDNTLLLQLFFDFDGQPMVSTQWFARSE